MEADITHTKLELQNITRLLVTNVYRNHINFKIRLFRVLVKLQWTHLIQYVWNKWLSKMAEKINSVYSTVAI